MEYYVKECGDILGVSQQISNGDDPKAILHFIFEEIFKYKCSATSWSQSALGHGGVNMDEVNSNKAIQSNDDNSYIDSWILV